MSLTLDAIPASSRSAAWKWGVCGLLFLATLINYMDRLTLNQTAKRVKDELHLTNEQYGQTEQAFGIAFAVGALLTGWVVDRWNVRWVFPVVVLAWSAAGILTGFAQSLAGLLAFRFLLGLFEAGNWPCALRTTQRVLAPHERTLGNSLLQSGAAVGAVLLPLAVQALLDGPGSWRVPFWVIGAAGTPWVLFWLLVVRTEDLALPPRAKAADTAPATREGSLLDVYRDRRFVVLVVIVVTINLTWHFFRVWLPLFLREDHGYSEDAVNYFTSAYYGATYAGTLTAGFATLYLARRGLAVHQTRVLVFLGCSLLTTLSVAVAILPAGPALLGLLLVIGFGALGLFPAYYSLSQDLTTRHQGMLTGTLGCTTWLVTATMHPLVGRWLDRTHDYSLVVALAGLFPLVGFATLVLLWRTPAASPVGAGGGL